MIEAIRTTVVGGVVFLVPFVALALVLGKAFSIMKQIAEPIAALLPPEAIAGILLIDLLAIVAILLVCLVAGIVARSARVRALGTKLEHALLSTIPGYQFVKGLAESLADSDEMAESFVPVLARFDDYSQIAFEVERTDAGVVVVYLPGAPNPWSGSVAYVDPQRIERLDITVADAVRNIRALGRDSSSLPAAALATGADA